MSKLAIARLNQKLCFIWVGYGTGVYVGDMTWWHRPDESWIPLVCGIIVILCIRVNVRSIAKLEVKEAIDEWARQEEL